jgi:hypothetical protein
MEQLSSLPIQLQMPKLAQLNPHDKLAFLTLVHLQGPSRSDAFSFMKLFEYYRLAKQHGASIATEEDMRSTIYEYTDGYFALYNRVMENLCARYQNILEVWYTENLDYNPAIHQQGIVVDSITKYIAHDVNSSRSEIELLIKALSRQVLL